MGLSCILGHDWEFEDYRKGYSQSGWFAGTDIDRNFKIWKVYRCSRCLKEELKTIMNISEYEYNNLTVKQILNDKEDN